MYEYAKNLREYVFTWYNENCCEIKIDVVAGEWMDEDLNKYHIGSFIWTKMFALKLKRNFLVFYEKWREDESKKIGGRYIRSFSTSTHNSSWDRNNANNDFPFEPKNIQHFVFAYSHTTWFWSFYQTKCM